MREQTARKFCNHCTNIFFRYGKGAFIENPAVKFTQNAKAGKYDSLSDKEYCTLLHEIEELAAIWNGSSRKPAGEILTAILTGACKPDPVPKNSLTDILTCILSSSQDPGPDDSLDPNEPSQEFQDGPDAQFDDLFDGGTQHVIATPFQPRPPKVIRDGITSQVIGQPEAVKAASMIMYHHLSGRRTNAVFCGPSGCGKSEIWRTLSTEYPGLIRMMDFSLFAADGWNGSLHMRDIFNDTDPENIRQNGLIVVLDEADKILCEAAVGAGGTDHHVLLQNNLLKIMDGDVIEFGEDSKKPALSVDCSKVSVVMLGAFERLLSGKVQKAKHIGFGSSETDAGAAEQHKNISHEDLIRAGMRREIAGRVNKIVALNPLSVDGYRAILTGPVLDGVEKSIDRKIIVDRSAADALAAEAISSGLGVRWMRSALMNVIDEAMFDMPDAPEYRITARHGELRCRARRPRSGGHAAKRSRQDCSHPECGVVMEDLPF